MHYHLVNVAARQEELLGRLRANPVSKDNMLVIPALAGDRQLTRDEIEKELNNIAQGTLGYSVRWIDQGIGCSKVPDIDGKNRMEDRATLLIKAKVGGNWLHHNVLTDRQVRDAFARMTRMVDAQNAGDPNYVLMADDLEENVAYNAGLNLVLQRNETMAGGRNVERALHEGRRAKKTK
jgi:malate synthase